MKKNKLAIIPIRKGSERVKNKNLKAFHDTNLLELKLRKLKLIEGLDIVVNTDSEEAIEVAKENRVHYHRREDYYASSKCNGSDFFRHIAENTSSEYDYLLYTPVTSPFVSVETVKKVITCFEEGGCDSVNTTTLVKHHMWLDGKPINYDPLNAPNSQNLPNIMSLNFAVNIISRDLMIKKKNVVGDNPAFVTLDQYESVDIDTEFDFEVAEILYKQLLSRNKI